MAVLGARGRTAGALRGAAGALRGRCGGTAGALRLGLRLGPPPPRGWVRLAPLSVERVVGQLVGLAVGLAWIGLAGVPKSKDFPLGFPHVLQKDFPANSIPCRCDGR